MGKTPGILKNFINTKKNHKPAKTQKATLSSKRKNTKGRHNNTFADADMEGVISHGLEDTPIERMTGGKRTKRQSKTVIPRTETVSLGDKKRPAPARRYKEGVFARLKNRTKTVLSAEKKGKKDTALEFAASQRRSGKKGRRNKRIALYAGSSLVVAAVLLAVFLGRQGEAATVPPAATNSSPAASVVVLSTQDSSQTRSAEQYAYGGSVSTPQPEITSVETTVPTITPTTDPTATPTEASAPVETTPPDETPMPINIDDLVKDFRVEADLYYNDVGYSTNHYEYTDDEVYMLAQLISGEARGESFEGMVAVGNVVMNRVLLRGHFGSTIKQVITARGQFTGYSSSIRPSSSCL
jgi:hypothetical protein